MSDPCERCILIQQCGDGWEVRDTGRPFSPYRCPDLGIARLTAMHLAVARGLPVRREDPAAPAPSA